MCFYVSLEEREIPDTEHKGHSTPGESSKTMCFNKPAVCVIKSLA